MDMGCSVPEKLPDIWGDCCVYPSALLISTGYAACVLFVQMVDMRFVLLISFFNLLCRWGEMRVRFPMGLFTVQFHLRNCRRLFLSSPKTGRLRQDGTLRLFGPRSD